MLTRKAYEATPQALHQPYYLEVARAASLAFDAATLARLGDGLGTGLRAGLGMDDWTRLAETHAEAIAAADKARGGAGDVVAGVCAWMALARHLASVLGPL